MATNDTDPQAPPPFDTDASSTDPTDPGNPPDAAADVAASLLADLARGSLPRTDVRETEGHVAAAYAARPHHPPRANEKTVENAAVLVNATVPLARPSASASGSAAAPAGRGLGPPAPSVVSMSGAPTVPGSRAFEMTSPGERARYRTRVILASIGGALVAAVVALGLLAVSSSSSSSSSSPPPRAPANSAAPSTASAPAADLVLPGASIAMPPSVPVSAAAPSSNSSNASNSVKPAHGARPPRSSPSSGTFAAPDRSF
jgi:hypothetical protein